MSHRTPATPARHLLRPALQALVGLLLSVGLAPPAGASDDHDHERARQAVQAGQVLPLRTVLEQLEREHPGQVLEVELEQDDGVWAYEVKLLTSGGQLVKLKLDARSAALLGSKSRLAERAAPRRMH